MAFVDLYASPARSGRAPYVHLRSFGIDPTFGKRIFDHSNFDVECASRSTPASGLFHLAWDPMCGRATSPGRTWGPDDLPHSPCFVRAAAWNGIVDIRERDRSRSVPVSTGAGHLFAQMGDPTPNFG